MKGLLPADTNKAIGSRAATYEQWKIVAAARRTGFFGDPSNGTQVGLQRTQGDVFDMRNTLRRQRGFRFYPENIIELLCHICGSAFSRPNDFCRHLHKTHTFDRATAIDRLVAIVKRILRALEMFKQILKASEKS